MRRIKKFEEVSHGPFKAVIRLDPKHGLFSCDYGAAIFESPILDKVRQWAREQLRAMSKLDWVPVMQVNFNARDDRVNNLRNCANVNCWMDRFYAAWDGAKWVRAPWVVMPPGSYLCSGPAAADMDQASYPMPEQTLMEARIAEAKPFWHAPAAERITWPLVAEGGSWNEYYVPWTQERWNTLRDILARLRELRSRIGQLLACEDGWTRLAAIASTKLLAAPQSPEDGHNSAGHNWHNPEDASDVS